MCSSDLHLSGRILKPSLGTSFGERWTYCLLATLASRSPQQDCGKEQTTKGTYGQPLQTEFPFFSQPSAFLKTSRDTSALDCRMSSETWAAEATRRRGAYSQRLKSARLTNANGFSSWPTVGANEDSYRIGGDSQASKSLSGMARRGELSWPTASVRDHKGAPQSRLTPEGYNARLDEAVVIYGRAAQANPSMDGSRQESWATPRNCGGPDFAKANRPSSPSKSPSLPTQVSGKLNPRWVETLMGLPVGWVMPSCASPVTIAPMNCVPSAMELFPQPPQSPSQP